MEPIRCPETSVTNYQRTPRNIPEELRPQLYRGGSLKSHKSEWNIVNSVTSLYDGDCLWFIHVTATQWIMQHYKIEVRSTLLSNSRKVLRTDNSHYKIKFNTEDAEHN
jgi:hypothetical protein